MTNHTDALRAEALARMLEWARCSRIIRTGGRIAPLALWPTPRRVCLTVIEHAADGSVMAIRNVGELWGVAA